MTMRESIFWVVLVLVHGLALLSVLSALMSWHHLDRIDAMMWVIICIWIDYYVFA